MNDRGAFLGAICAEPDDDLRRLGFADWLDEQDDPNDARQAAFIRVQCEMKKKELLWFADHRHPDIAALEKRQQPLLDHAVAWAPHSMQHRISAANFERGFPYIWRMFASDLVSGADIDIRRFLQTAPIDVFNFNGLYGRVADTFADNKGLREVRGLEIQQRGTSEEVLGTVLASPHLTRLRRLNVLWCELRTRMMQVIAESPAAPTVTSFGFDMNAFGPRAAQIFARHPGFRNAEEVTFLENPLQDAGATAIARTTHRKLRLLCLTHCGIGKNGAKALLESEPLSKTVIDLEGNPVPASLQKTFKKEMVQRAHALVG